MCGVGEDLRVGTKILNKHVSMFHMQWLETMITRK